MAEERLGHGDLLLLYSDGIIERPGRAPAQSTVELATVAGRIARGEAFHASDGPPVDQLCGQTLELLTRETGYADDITLLAAQRVAATGPLQLAIEARPEALREVRRAVADWLRPLAVRPLDEMAVQHAIGEVVTNAVDHAYRDRADDAERPLRIVARLDGTGGATVTVTDRGSWRYGARDERGRGLQMVNTLCEHVTVDRDPDGTTVTLTCPMARSVALMQGADGSGGGARNGAFGMDQSDGLLAVRGPVDMVSADEFRSVLLRLTGGRLPEVRVDLSAVTLLASAGVQVLYDALHRADDQGISLQLQATPGSVAQHVLDLVGLPHAPPDAAPESV